MTDTPPLSTPKKLTRKQKVFIEVYLATWNATEAARQAKYKDPNTAGPALPKNPEIKAVIDARMAEYTMSANEVLTRLTQQAQVNPADFFLFEDKPVLDKDGKKVLDPVTNEPTTVLVMVGINWGMFKTHGHLVKKLTYTRTGYPVLEFEDKQNALIQIGRKHKLFVDRTEVTGKDGDVIKIKITGKIPDGDV